MSFSQVPAWRDWWLSIAALSSSIWFQQFALHFICTKCVATEASHNCTMAKSFNITQLRAAGARAELRGAEPHWQRNQIFMIFWRIMSQNSSSLRQFLAVSSRGSHAPWRRMSARCAAGGGRRGGGSRCRRWRAGGSAAAAAGCWQRAAPRRPARWPRLVRTRGSQIELSTNLREVSLSISN